MKPENESKTSFERGISANTVMLPIIGVLAALYIVIIILIIHINSTGMGVSQLMQMSSDYTENATALLAGSSLMAETSMNFIMMPLAENGTVNVYPLIAYANELGIDRRGDQVVERFRGYDVSAEAFHLIVAAADSANFLMDAQIHAISLVCADYPLPDRPPLNMIPLRELTAEEQAMSAEERLAAARRLFLNSEYSQHKQAVSENVNACVASIKATNGYVIAETSRHFEVDRILLWISMIVVIAIMAFNFFVLYRWLILPLDDYVRLIDTDETLDDGKGLREVRLLAGAYNRLLKRRDGLESILRSAAETDTLTGLPNRYGFEQYLLESGRSGYSLAVFLFDINYLKVTNDTLGHAAGDKLIRSAADCIRECFGLEDENNCFRFGGDEFAAVEKNCAREKIDRMVKHFELSQAERGISISWGYAFTEEIGNTTVKKMMDEADKHMYERKEKMHGKRSGEKQGDEAADGACDEKPTERV